MTNIYLTERILNNCIKSAGIFLGFLGLIIMAAWQMQWDEFLKVGQGFNAVHFYTGFLFFLSGIALFSTQFNNLKFLSIAGAFSALIYTIIAASKYIVPDGDLNLNLFDGKFSHQIAPNTILCFLIANTSLLLWNFGRVSDIRINTVILPALIITTLAFIALLGYVFGIENAYSWWGYSGMAFHTSYGLIILGLSLFMLARTSSFNSKKVWPKKSIITGALGVGFTLLIVQISLFQDRAREEQMVRLEAEKGARIVDSDLKRIVNGLMRMQDRWNVLGIPGEFLQKDASNYVRYNPSIFSLAFLDKNFKPVEEIVRPGMRRGVIDYQKQIPRWINLPGKNIFIAERPENDTGKNLTLFYVPVGRDNEHTKFLAIAYGTGYFLNEILSFEGNTHIFFRVYQKSDLVYPADYRFAPVDTAITKIKNFDLHGTKWEINATYNRAGHENRNLILLVFMAGLGLSMLLANLFRQTEKIQDVMLDLKISEERHALATAAANIGVWDWDTENEKIVWAGNAYKIWGAPNNRSLPDTTITLRARMPEEDRLKNDDVISKSLQEKDMFTVEFRIQRLDNNQEVWLQSSGRSVEMRGGKSIRSSGILMDITERKKIENYLIRSNQELEQFAYVASHDLKAPLRSIDNLAKWVLEDAGDNIQEDAKDKLELLRGRVSRLEILLDDILSYSRAGRILETPVKLDVKKMFEALKDVYIPQGFQFQITSEFPSIISAKTPLEQVLGNLINNAVKHHDKPDGIIKVSIEEEMGYYRFTITDDGPGIPEEFHERVFQMFQTLQSRDKVDGSGLGMSIVKKLVEWQGGKVWIKSPLNDRGTSIIFLWPRSYFNKN